jgi:acyl-CoA synthetase (AMP-forming)/AMP-acid ligase II
MALARGQVRVRAGTVAPLGHIDGRSVDPKQPLSNLVAFETSGTSGAPKVVLHSHATLAAGILSSVSLQTGNAVPEDPDALSDTLAATDIADPPVVFATAMPFWTIAGFVTAMRALLTGNTVVALAGLQPTECLEVLKRERVNILASPPLVGRQLLRTATRHPELRLDDLFAFGLGGGPAPADLLADIEYRFGCITSIGYGMTETAGPIAMSKFTDPLETRATSVGYPVPGMKIAVGHPGTLEATHGELYVSGPALFLGYLSGGDNNARVRSGGRTWFRTGDLATIRPEGSLVLEGRVDGLIIRGGRNIDAGRIEQTLHTNPAVLSATVVGVPNRRLIGEQDIVAVVAAAHGTAQITTSALRAYCAARLPPHEVPSRFIIIGRQRLGPDGTIPRTFAESLARQ